MISGTTQLAGFFASPANHSLSPLMHNYAFRACGIDAVYLAFDIDENRLPAALEGIKTMNMLGVNLSMPNKSIVLPYLDEMSQATKLIGACNTIVHKNGRLIGHNTDGIGFMRSIYEENVHVIGQKMTILGAGGAAKAIIVQAALDGIAEIAVYKRKNHTFDKIKHELAVISEQTGCSICVHDYAQTQQLTRDVEESILLVNATNIGMGENVECSPVPTIDVFRKELAVADLIYHPTETKFLKDARENGAKTINGLGMLLYQGATAFSLWTNEEMPIEEIRPLLIKGENKKL
ncbi:MAG: shikimate dehydrogenase [Enterococcus sp.]